MELFGVGVPTWPSPSTRWDWWPFVGIVLALVMCARIVRLPLRPIVLIVSVAFGPIFAGLVHTWGVVTAIASVVAISGCISWGRNRRTGDDPASPV